MTKKPRCARPRKSLRRRFLASHLWIAAVGVVILLAAWVVTSYLRTSALHLATTSGPLAHTATQIQSSLHSALATLRGWTAIRDESLRRENTRIWNEEIYPALARLQSLYGEEISAEQRRGLAQLKAQLADLEEWHWYIADVAHTPGNEPARDAMNDRVFPVAQDVFEQTSRLIDTESSADRLRWLAEGFGYLMYAESFLQEFVSNSRGADLNKFDESIERVDRAMQRLDRASAKMSADRQGDLRRLQRETRAYKRHAARVVKLRQRPDWNVSYYWLAKHAAPRAEAIHKLLRGIVEREQRHMQADERSVIRIGRLAPWVTVGLLLAMLIMAALLSGRGARRLTRPILNLAEASRDLASGRLQEDIPSESGDELDELTESFNAMRRAIKERQAQIQNDETRLRTTISTVVDALITINDRGIIESVNPATQSIFGYAEEEVIGKNVSMLMPEPYRSAHDGYMRRYLDTNEARIIGIGREVTGLRKSGEEFPADLAISEMWVNEERKFVGLIRDITERKKVDQMKSEFVSVVSHELRTPLTSIRGSLGLLTSPVVGALPDSAQELLSIAVRSTDRLIRLINDILDLEKIEAGQIAVKEETIDVGPFLEHAVEANQGMAHQYEVTLQLKDLAPGAKVHADRDRLMQVVTNLVSNAVKFSPAGAAVELMVKQEGNDICFSVKDQGPGIPEEFQSKIFDRFSQADTSATRKQGGTGLGLSIARSIIELHGGTIGFTTEAGQGTTFTFTLPKMVAVEVTRPQAKLSTAIDGIRVLVCEDDKDVARLLQMLLEQEGCICDIAYDATQAKKALGAKDYATLFLDLNLPDQDGLSLVAELRAQESTRGLPVVVISATADQRRNEIDGEAFEILEWMNKPIDAERLVSVLDQALIGVSQDKPRVLYVEDDHELAALVPEILREDVCTTVVATLAQARRALQEQKFDLAILDLALPDGYGLDLVPLLNATQPTATPIVVFSADEVPPEFASQVSASLVKSRTGNESFAKAIRRHVSQARRRSMTPAELQ